MKKFKKKKKKKIASGINIVLNGFGPKNEIDALTKSLAEDSNVEVMYHPADMSKPDQIKDLIIQVLLFYFH